MILSEIGLVGCWPSGRVVHFEQPVVLDGVPFVIKYCGRALAVVTQSGGVETVLIYDPMGNQSGSDATVSMIVENRSDARRELLSGIINGFAGVSLIEPGIVGELMDIYTGLQWISWIVLRFLI